MICAAAVASREKRATRLAFDENAADMNFTDLQYMNSSGIGLLIMLLIRAQRQGQQMLAFGLREHYAQIFELTRLNEAIQVFESEAEALAAAG